MIDDVVQRPAFTCQPQVVQDNIRHSLVVCRVVELTGDVRCDNDTFFIYENLDAPSEQPYMCMS